MSLVTYRKMVGLDFLNYKNLTQYIPHLINTSNLKKIRADYYDC